MKILSQKTQDLLKHILRKEFDTKTGVWHEHDAIDILTATKELGLTELAQEMYNDLHINN